MPVGQTDLVTLRLPGAAQDHLMLPLTCVRLAVSRRSAGQPSERPRREGGRALPIRGSARCPPGVRILLMRPAAAQRVTVFGSTLKRAATSPGVSSRSLLLSTISPPRVPRPAAGGQVNQCAERSLIYPWFSQKITGCYRLSARLLYDRASLGRSWVFLYKSTLM